MKIKNINIFFALLLAFIWGCEEKSNLEPEGLWELSQPVLAPINDGNNLILDENSPLSTIDFSWSEATSSDAYSVYYTILIDSVNATDSSNPIIAIQAQNGGKSTNASISTQELNEALYMAGFKPSVDLELNCTIVASCLSKSTIDELNFTVVRYDDDNLFLSGLATEVGDNASNAILMKRLNNGAGEKLNLYETYTQLEANKPFLLYNGRSETAITYGLDAEGNLVRDGEAIMVENEGIYRINIDLDAMTISYFKIDRLALIGDALENSWDSDEAMMYKGMGVWQSDISFVKAGSYIIRANNDWQGIIKQVNNTANEVVLEEFGNAQGYSFDNFQQSEAGFYTVTLNLTGEKYTLDLEKAPEQRMYIIVNGSDSYEMTLVGEGKFATTSYIALQTADDILINTKSDGSGTSYSISETIGEGEGDKVEATVALSESSSAFSTLTDQAYGFIVDVNTDELKWHYYNIKLFHWDDEAEGGWDAKTETLLIYSHPYTFTATTNLQADFESKFFSPWDVQFGAGANDDASALEGTVSNDAGAANLKNITNSGSYEIKLIVSADLSTATYEFIAQ